jgi:hypothetical protein
LLNVELYFSVATNLLGVKNEMALDVENGGKSKRFGKCKP